MRASVIGAGAWGTVFAGLLRDRGHDVELLGRGPAQAVSETDLLVVAVPSRSFADVVATLPAKTPMLTLTKGLDPATSKRLSEIAGWRHYAVLSGPNFAEEIAAGLPAAAVVASADPEFAELLQGEIGSQRFRIYVNDDLVGVELCGAAKNVVALAAGIVDGLQLGDNAKAALMTRGLAEMSRLGVACGARAESFAGLAGWGDLVATCWHREGRNRRAGELLGRGSTAQDAVAEIGTVEGLTTAPALRDLAHQRGVELPITEAICAVIDGTEVRVVADELMGRRQTGEPERSSTL